MKCHKLLIQEIHLIWISCINNLVPSVSEKYQGVPEGTTYIDLNDHTSSKWIKEESSFLYFYGDSGHWIPLDDKIHCNMSLREI